MTPHLHTSSKMVEKMAEANTRIPHIDPQIHTVDIAQFTQFGFEEKVVRLANRSGFQPGMIRDVYKHTSTFKQAENITKAMRVAAVKCAASKIRRRVTLYGDGEDGDGEEQEEEEEEEEEGGNKNDGDKNEDKDVKDEDK
ncbi:hypothetical protein EV424DRAFT_1546652 [Suillus variegatus]|nr:hypothetical protein EV424DRAFT_1546652 [Suillus variegatus]